MKDTHNLCLNQLCDETLMQRFQCFHDEAAFTLLVRRHSSQALAVSRNYLKDINLAEDAVQEAFIRVVRKKNRYKADKPFGPWFYKLLCNVCLDYLRKKKAYLESLSHFEHECSLKSDATEGTHIHKVLETLNEIDRTVILFRVQQGMTYGEIAAALRISEDAVKKRAQRAASRLRGKYTPEEVLSVCRIS